MKNHKIRLTHKSRNQILTAGLLCTQPIQPIPAHPKPSGTKRFFLRGWLIQAAAYFTMNSRFGHCAPDSSLAASQVMIVGFCTWKKICDLTSVRRINPQMRD
jgi:hypothetical protein